MRKAGVFWTTLKRSRLRKDAEVAEAEDGMNRLWLGWVDLWDGWRCRWEDGLVGGWMFR